MPSHPINLQAESHVLQEPYGDVSEHNEELSLLADTDQAPHLGGRLG